MRVFIIIIFCGITGSIAGQSVNEKITVQLSQPPLLRVDAGNDLNLSESGSAVIGESLNVTGGTPDYSYVWNDKYQNEYLEQTPEVFNPGKYWLNVTDKNNCSALDSLTVNDYGTGIPPFEGDLEQFLRLDHFGKLLYIDLPEVRGEVIITIISIEGKILYSYTGNNSGDQFSHLINIASLKKGVYLISVRYNHVPLIMKFVLK